MQFDKVRITYLFYLIFISSQVYSQKYHKFNRELFHLLPNDLPDSINCIDLNGQMQGWWIDYALSYSSGDKSTCVPKGHYVEEYSYGKYKDNRKIGDWRTISNIHFVMETKHENYYYNTDTIIIRTNFFDYKTILYFNSDSSIVSYTYINRQGQKEICIECDINKIPKDSNCLMTYKSKFIKAFPYNKFETEVYKSSLMYIREKFLIDEAIKEKE